MGELAFDDPALAEALEAADLESTDSLPFGVITMDRTGDVLWYNAHEAAHTGLDPDRVAGKNFFETVGPCTNNYLIAQRYLDEDELDETLDFVFTVRLAPTPVRLRLLARAGSERQYLVVSFP